MTHRTYQTFQALILAVMGLFLIFKLSDGNILFYIKRRYLLLILLAGLGFIILSQVLLRSRPAIDREMAPIESPEKPVDHENQKYSGWNLWWVILPLLFGILIPARPLGSSAVANRGINSTAPLTSGGALTDTSLSIPPDERDILDWIRVFNQVKPTEKLAGQTVDVTGFIYHDIRLKDGDFMVGRFALTCCVADALAVGMVVSAWPGASQLPDNGWVRVQGTIIPYSLDHQVIPGIKAQNVDSIPEPQQPYLFP
jgi:putative membrane protein